MESSEVDGGPAIHIGRVHLCGRHLPPAGLADEQSETRKMTVRRRVMAGCPLQTVAGHSIGAALQQRLGHLLLTFLAGKHQG